MPDRKTEVSEYWFSGLFFECLPFRRFPSRITSPTSHTSIHPTVAVPSRPVTAFLCTSGCPFSSGKNVPLECLVNSAQSVNYRYDIISPVFIRVDDKAAHCAKFSDKHYHCFPEGMLAGESTAEWGSRSPVSSLRAKIRLIVPSIYCIRSTSLLGFKFSGPFF